MGWRSAPNRRVSMLLAVLATVPPAFGAERMFVGYYPSWMDAANQTACAALSKLACAPAAYSHIVIAFAQPDFSWDGENWTGTGLQFAATPEAVKRAIAMLHGRGVRVLLAVGGQKYVSWAPLAAEAQNGGPVTAALARILADLGFDGLDVDYEAPDDAPVSQYADAVTALRRAAGPDKILSLAAWSTGADCTPATGLEPCGGKASKWPAPAGRERLLLHDRDMVRRINIINVMSYDGGTESYDPVTAYRLYRDLVPSRVVVNIGLETAPQGWGNATLVSKDNDADCPGAVIAADQFGGSVNRPYSVERLLDSGPLAPSRNANPHDGAMLWHLLKDQGLPLCGTKAAASPQEIATTAGVLLGRIPEGSHVD